MYSFAKSANKGTSGSNCYTCHSRTAQFSRGYQFTTYKNNFQLFIIRKPCRTFTILHYINMITRYGNE